MLQFLGRITTLFKNKFTFLFQVWVEVMAIEHCSIQGKTIIFTSLYLLHITNVVSSRRSIRKTRYDIQQNLNHPN